MSQFYIDESLIPPDKLADPRLAWWKEAVEPALKDKTNRAGVCLHEAAHAVYLERAGAKAIFHPPTVLYDPRNDTFGMAAAGVHGEFGTGAKVDSLVMARYFVAGGVAKRVLTKLTEDSFDDGGDEQDLIDWTETGEELGMSSEVILAHWEEAKRDVEKDLRSPAFRRQLWKRAWAFEGQLLDGAMPTTNAAMLPSYWNRRLRAQMIRTKEPHQQP